MAAAALMAKTIDGRMPGLFGRLPRLATASAPIPAETAEGTTTAYYQPGSPAAGIAGTYYVNTSKLDQRPLWELPALTAHEAVPGHHNQIALQQELDLPPFRRNFASSPPSPKAGASIRRASARRWDFTTRRRRRSASFPTRRGGRRGWWSIPASIDGLGQGAGGGLHARESALSDANIDAEVDHISGRAKRSPTNWASSRSRLRTRARASWARNRPSPLPRRSAGPGIGAARRARGADRRLDRGGEGALTRPRLRRVSRRATARAPHPPQPAAVRRARRRASGPGSR